MRLSEVNRNVYNDGNCKFNVITFNSFKQNAILNSGAVHLVVLYIVHFMFY